MRSYVLFFSAACCLYSIGAIVQIVLWPSDFGHNTLVAAFIYVLGALVMSDGVLRRAYMKLSITAYVVSLSVILYLTYYFYYVHDSLIIRIYILNLGCGLILVACVLVRVMEWTSGRWINRVLYWMLVLFAFQFFARTFVFVGDGDASDVRSFVMSPFWLTLQAALSVFGAALALTTLAASAIDLIEDLENDRDTDSLTQLLNRRGFDGKATKRLRDQDNRRRPDQAEPLSLIVCDIDFFKSLNDTFGHAAGDAVLAEFGTLLRRITSAHDLIARVGGEEFVILLELDANGSRLFAERVRTTLERTRFSALPASRNVTASFGVSERTPAETLHKLLARADRALYAAKKAGRNCIVVAPQRAV